MKTRTSPLVRVLFLLSFLCLLMGLNRALAQEDLWIGEVLANEMDGIVVECDTHAVSEEMQGKTLCFETFGSERTLKMETDLVLGGYSDVLPYEGWFRNDSDLLMRTYIFIPDEDAPIEDHEMFTVVLWADDYGESDIGVVHFGRLGDL